MIHTERPGPTLRLTTEEHTEAGERSREDRVAAEEPLEIRLAWPGAPARRVWVTMRTPGHDFELAAGWLLHEGIAGPARLHTVAYCTDEDLTPQQEFNVVTATLDAPPARDVGHRHVAASTGSSACGVCGKDSVEDALATPRAARWAGPAPHAGRRTRPARPAARGAAGVRRDRRRARRRRWPPPTASCSSCARTSGRHNAVDKVTGARVLAGAPVAEAVLVVSGRAGFELVQKAVAAGVGSLVAVGAPTSLAVGLAREAGLGLWGFTRADPHRPLCVTEFVSTAHVRNGGRRTEPRPGSERMLTLTENASTVVKGIADQIPEANGLRITSLPTDEAQPPSFDVAPAADAEPGDEVVEADGATVYLDGGAAQELDDKVLDASVDQEGRVEFALAPQG